MKQNNKNVSPMSNQSRNTYVIEHITQALIELLKEKDIEEISISELCDLAGIGRASFYRNFNTKEDIIKTYINKLLKDLLQNTSFEQNNSLSYFLHILFNHFEKHLEFYTILNQRKLIYLIKDVLVDICGLKKDQSKEEAYASAYFVYIIYGWIEVWFQRGMKESADEIAQMFKDRGL